MRKSFKILLTAIVLTLWGMTPIAADPRLQSLQTADENRGWEAVGRLDIGDAGFCTAALITVDMVLTAAHCLFDPATGNPIDLTEIEFQAGLRHGRAEAYRGIRRAVMHPDYAFAEGTRLDGIGVDLALLELDRSVRLGHVTPFGTQARVEAGQGVQVVSYGKDRAEAPSREDDCRILARDAKIFVLSCKVEFGSSGAPIFADFGGELRIVSVVSAMARWQGQDVSLAAVMEGELDVLIREFDQGPTRDVDGRRLAVSGTVRTIAQE